MTTDEEILTDDFIRKIIEIYGMIGEDGRIWGKDTDCGDIETDTKYIRNLLLPKMKLAREDVLEQHSCYDYVQGAEVHKDLIHKVNEKEKENQKLKEKLKEGEEDYDNKVDLLYKTEEKNQKFSDALTKIANSHGHSASWCRAIAIEAQTGERSEPNKAKKALAKKALPGEKEG